MDDALLMSVLNGVADRHEQLQPFARRQHEFCRNRSVMGMPLTSSMTKKGRAGVGGAGVEHLGDVGVIHESEGLPFGLEASQDLAAIHARLDDLESDVALTGVGLLGQPDRAHAAFADAFESLYGPIRRRGNLCQACRLGAMNAASGAGRMLECRDRLLARS